MAKPITKTPKLTAKESEAFLRKVKADLKKPIGLVATPKLEEAIKLICSHAQDEER